MSYETRTSSSLKKSEISWAFTSRRQKTSPPENAAVFCVDEKTAVQALERSQPLLPMQPRRPVPKTGEVVLVLPRASERRSGRGRGPDNVGARSDAIPLELAVELLARSARDLRLVQEAELRLFLEI